MVQRVSKNILNRTITIDVYVALLIPRVEAKVVRHVLCTINRIVHERVQHVVVVNLYIVVMDEEAVIIYMILHEVITINVKLEQV